MRQNLAVFELHPEAIGQYARSGQRILGRVKYHLHACIIRSPPRPQLTTSAAASAGAALGATIQVFLPFPRIFLR